MNSEIYRIIVGTNRVGSNSRKVGSFYKSVFYPKALMLSWLHLKTSTWIPALLLLFLFSSFI
jgi:hypothetical protein